MDKLDILKRVHKVLEAQEAQQKDKEEDEEANKLAAILMIASDMFEPKKST